VLTRAALVGDESLRSLVTYETLDLLRGLLPAEALDSLPIVLDDAPGFPADLVELIQGRPAEVLCKPHRSPKRSASAGPPVPRSAGGRGGRPFQVHDELDPEGKPTLVGALLLNVAVFAALASGLFCVAAIGRLLPKTVADDYGLLLVFGLGVPAIVGFGLLYHALGLRLVRRLGLGKSRRPQERPGDRA
jgi:hypothetical protein